jgi:hypothetical protein
VRDRNDGLTGPYHLAGFDGFRDNDTWGIGAKLAVAEMVLGFMQLRLCDSELGLGGLKASLRRVVLNLGGPALVHQGSLPVHVVAGFVESCLSGGKLGLRLVQGIALRLQIELGDQVIRLHHASDVHLARNHLPIDAEREVLLCAGANVAGELQGLSSRASGGGDGSDRPDLGRGLRLLAASQKSES